MSHQLLAEIQTILDEAAATYALRISKSEDEKQLSPPKPTLIQAKEMRKHFRKASSEIDLLKSQPEPTNTERLEHEVSILRKEMLVHSRKRRYSVRDIPERLNPTDSYSFRIVESFQSIQKLLPSTIYLMHKAGLWWYIVTPRPIPKPVLTPTPLSAAKTITRHTIVPALFKMKERNAEIDEKLAIQIRDELRPEGNHYRVKLVDALPEKQDNDTIYIWFGTHNKLHTWQYIITPSAKKPVIQAPKKLCELTTMCDEDIRQLTQATIPNLAFAEAKRDLIEAIVPGNNTYMTLQHLKRTAEKARKIAGKDATTALLAPIANEFLNDLMAYIQNPNQIHSLLVSIYNYVRVIDKSQSSGKEGVSSSVACDVLLHAARNLPAEKMIDLYQHLKPILSLLNNNEDALTQRITENTVDSLKEKRLLLRTKNWVHMDHFKKMHFVMTKNIEILSSSLDAVYQEITGHKIYANKNENAPSAEHVANHYEYFIQNIVEHQFDDIATTNKQEFKLNAAVRKLLADLSSSAGNWFSWFLNEPNKPGWTWSFNPNKMVRSLQTCHRTFLQAFPNEDPANLNRLFAEMLNTHYTYMHLNHPSRFNRLQHILHSQEFYEIEETAKRCRESITDERQASINDLSTVLDLVRSESDKVQGAEQIDKPNKRLNIQAQYVQTIKNSAKEALELTQYCKPRR